MKYLENQVIQKLFTSAPSYRKTVETLLRIPFSQEIGNEFTTYVKDGSKLRVEVNNKILSDSIVARNHGQIGKLDGRPIFNEWLISKDKAISLYGEDTINNLTTDFTSHKKNATIKAVKLNKKILEKLGIEGDILEITVDWSNEPMRAKIGDYITDQNYSISAEDMSKTYEMVCTIKKGLSTKIKP